MEDLPLEILTLVAAELELDDFWACLQVSRTWRHAFSQPLVAIDISRQLCPGALEQAEAMKSDETPIAIFKRSTQRSIQRRNRCAEHRTGKFWILESVPGYSEHAFEGESFEGEPWSHIRTGSGFHINANTFLTMTRADESSDEEVEFSDEEDGSWIVIADIFHRERRVIAGPGRALAEFGDSDINVHALDDVLLICGNLPRGTL